MNVAQHKDDWLSNLLREWAELRPTLLGLGYPSATPVWNALHAAFGGEFQSRVPAGVESRILVGDMKRLVKAMDLLLADQDVGDFILVVQSFYLYGMAKTALVLGKSRTKLYGTVKAGELLITREMNRR